MPCRFHIIIIMVAFCLFNLGCRPLPFSSTLGDLVPVSSNLDPFAVKCHPGLTYCAALPWIYVESTFQDWYFPETLVHHRVRPFVYLFLIMTTQTSNTLGFRILWINLLRLVPQKASKGSDKKAEIYLNLSCLYFKKAKSPNALRSKNQ